MEKTLEAIEKMIKELDLEIESMRVKAMQLLKKQSALKLQKERVENQMGKSKTSLEE